MSSEGWIPPAPHGGLRREAPLPAAALELIDRLADEFERAWTPAAVDPVERWVARGPVPLAGPLARELAKIDMELRGRRGMPVDLSRYLRRIPAMLDDDGWPPDDLVEAWERAEAPPPGRGTSPPLAAPAPVAPPTAHPVAVGPYQLLYRHPISRRPTVYDAVEGRSNALVLLTVYPPMRRADVEAARRFALAAAEASAEGSSAADGFLPVLSVGRADGCLHVVQHRPAGPTLAQRLAGGAVHWRQACRWAASAARAVAAVHDRPVARGERPAAHGSLSAAAVAVSGDDRVQLLGLPMPQADVMPIAADDPRVPSASPEVAWGLHADDARPADRFALGAILYHLLTGRPLYDQPDRREAVTKASTAAWDEAPLAARRVPAGLVEVLRRALQRDPRMRYATAAEFADAVEAGASRARRVRLVTAGAFVAVAVAAVLAAAILLWRPWT